jgi:hypothetical protein
MVPQLVMKFLAFYANRNFITALTSARPIAPKESHISRLYAIAGYSFKIYEYFNIILQYAWFFQAVSYLTGFPQQNFS